MAAQGRTKNPINIDEVEEIEALKGVFLTTLAYNSDVMLCNFKLNKGAKIPLHNHPNVQVGYVISGKIKFLKEKSESFIASRGDSYIFDSDEFHGAEVLENTVVIEVFSPSRNEYKPK
jgi:quercetin dioxygenase-like cupin family protein